jgi:anionic cell wall polymer biosynthesis LytR-Cps2A-Psr (LCP) family protein
MEGYDALAYVRSRHGSAGGDFSRSKRQQALLKGVRDRLFELDVLADLPAFFKKISNNMTTDVNLEILQYLAPTLKNGLKFEIKEVVLSTDNVLTTGTSANGQFIVMPKEGTQQWGEVHDFVNSGLE